jgi:glucoamylase
VHWGRDGWLAVEDTPTSDSGLGFHVAELPTATLSPGGWIDVTRRWQDTGEWAGQNERVEVVAAPQPLTSFATPQSASRAAK